MSAAEVLRALAIYRQMAPVPVVAAEVVEDPPAAPDEEPPAVAVEAAAADATVTPLDVTRKRGDAPVRG